MNINFCILPKTPENLSLFASFVSGILSLLKIILFFMSGFYILAISAWDSFIDSMVSLINKFVIQYSRTEADDNHPYGHGKAEPLAALAQGLLILSGALLFLWSTISDLIKGNVKGQTNLSGWLILFFLICALITGLLTWILKKGSIFHMSPALDSDAVHYQVDTIMNLGSAFAFFLIKQVKLPWIDPLIGVFFSLYILKLGVTLIFKNVQMLMDRSIPEEKKNQIIGEIFELSPNILNIHLFRGRQCGPRVLLDFHAGLDEKLTFIESHELVEAIEVFLKKRFQGDSVVHADPTKKVEKV